MTSPAADLAQYVAEDITTLSADFVNQEYSLFPAEFAASEGVFAGTTGWPINVSREPATPDDVITFYDTGGFQPDPDCELEEPTVQVRVRANGYLPAYEKMAAVKKKLIGPDAVFIGDYKYLGLRGDGDVTSLGYDENDRVILVFNLNMMREAI